MRETVKLALTFAIGAVTAVVLMMLFGPRDGGPPESPGTPRVAAAAVPAKAAASGPRKEWPAVQAGAKATATLSTKPSDGSLLYRLLLTNLPQSGLGFATDARLVIKLLDADGFAIAEVEVDPRENTKYVGPAGEVVGYEWLGASAIPGETYALVRQWNLSWSGITEPVAPVEQAAVQPPAAEPSAVPAAGVAAVPATTTHAAAQPATKSAPPVKRRWQEKSNWTKVTVGMSPQAVILTLGVPTRKTTAMNMETWYYGDLETGGNVFFVATEDGAAPRVKSVSKPRG